MKPRKSYVAIILTLLCIPLSCSPEGNQPLSNANNKGDASSIKTEEARNETFDFRQIRWGMSRDQVKASEATPPLVSNNEMIGFKTEVAGKEANCMYGLVDDKVALGMYQLQDLHSNKNDYFEDFAQFKKILAEKYGTPKVDEVEWKKKTYKDDPEDWGLAVSIGDLIYRAKWETDRTNILLILYGDKYDVTLMVRYDSKEFRPLFDEARKKKGLSDF